MFGLEHTPLEVLVLNLILAEVFLSIESRRSKKQYAEGQQTHRFHFIPAAER
jgi:hypothetical protein